jgi:hypothetical protein
MIYRMGQLAALQAAWSYDHTKPTDISICNEDSGRDDQGQYLKRRGARKQRDRVTG